jgi:hypothetical protein
LVIFFLSVGGFLSAYLLAHLSEGSLELPFSSKVRRIFLSPLYLSITGND